MNQGQRGCPWFSVSGLNSCDTFPLDDSDAQQYALGRLLTVLNVTDQHIGNRFGFCRNVLADGGETGRAVRGEGEIVKSQDGNILRNAEAELAEPLDQDGGSDVGTAEKCRGTGAGIGH